MPTLREVMQFLCDCAAQSGQGFSDDLARQLEQQLIRQFQGEKVYIPRPDMSQKARIAEAARHLPTGVVAQRFGVSRSWVHRVVKK